MARIRSIKPGFCTSEAIADLTIPCRLHFAMLWTYADDSGRGLDNPRLIKAALWPLDDDVDVSQIEEWQQELAEHGRLIRWEVDGKRYFEVVNFAEHQKPQKPQGSAIPAPSEGVPVPVRDRSGSATGTVPAVVVVGEVEVVGVGEGEGAPLALVPFAEPDPDELFELFWASYPRKVGKPGAKKAFLKAIKRASVAEIGAGLKAWKASWTDPDFIPHPQTWLNRDGWNDQLPAPKAAPMPKAADTIMEWVNGQ
jgi:hypothetical protein